MLNWMELEKFTDEIGTVFTKIDNSKYDYMLKDNDGIDYCTIEQMKDWGVNIGENYEND